MTRVAAAVPVPWARTSMEAEARTRRRLALLAPDAAFLWLGGVFGVVFVAVTPPLQAPDEVRHLGRAFLLAEGQIAAERTLDGARVSLPRDLVTLEQRLSPGLKYQPQRKQSAARIRRELSRPFRSDERILVTPPSLYSPLAYLPLAAAVGLGRMLDLAPLVWVYLGRLANLALWLGLLGLALRRAPGSRWLLALLALTPMSVFLAGSFSADATSNGLAFLFIACVLREREADGRLGQGSGLALLALAIAVGLAKQTYWPLCGALLLVPGRRFSGPRARAGWLGLAWLGSALPVALWSWWVQGLEPPPVAAGADPGAQLRLILGDPLAFAGVVAATLKGGVSVWVASFIGILGYVDTWLPGWTYWTTAAALLGVALLGPGCAPFRALDRAILLGVGLACFAGTLLVAYLGWNVVGAPHVDGVQGRYFIPFTPLLLLALGWRSRLDARVGALLGFHAGVVLAVAAGSVALRYWVG